MPLDLFPQLLGNPTQVGRIIELVGPRGTGKTTVLRRLFNAHWGAAKWLQRNDLDNVTLREAIAAVNAGYRFIVVDGWWALPDERIPTLDARVRMQLLKRLYMAAYSAGVVVLFTIDTTPWPGIALDGLPAQRADNCLKYYASDRLQFTRTANGIRVVLVKTKTKPSEGAHLFGDVLLPWGEVHHVQAP